PAFGVYGADTAARQHCQRSLFRVTAHGGLGVGQVEILEARHPGTDVLLRVPCRREQVLTPVGGVVYLDTVAAVALPKNPGRGDGERVVHPLVFWVVAFGPGVDKLGIVGAVEPADRHEPLVGSADAVVGDIAGAHRWVTVAIDTAGTDAGHVGVLHATENDPHPRQGAVGLGVPFGPHIELQRVRLRAVDVLRPQAPQQNRLDKAGDGDIVADPAGVVHVQSGDRVARIPHRVDDGALVGPVIQRPHLGALGIERQVVVPGELVAGVDGVVGDDPGGAAFLVIVGLVVPGVGAHQRT